MAASLSLGAFVFLSSFLFRLPKPPHQFVFAVPPIGRGTSRHLALCTFRRRAVHPFLCRSAWCARSRACLVFAGAVCLCFRFDYLVCSPATISSTADLPPPPLSPVLEEVRRARKSVPNRPLCDARRSRSWALAVHGPPPKLRHVLRSGRSPLALCPLIGNLVLSFCQCLFLERRVLLTSLFGVGVSM